MQELDVSEINLEQLVCLGRGACASTYKLDDATAIKVLNDVGKQMTDFNNLGKLVGVKNNTCIFPLEILKDGQENIGYTMQLVNGKNFHEVRRDIKLQDLIRAIRIAEQDIRKVSNDNIIFNDFNYGGIMWDEDNKTIKIIDTDFFIRSKDHTANECFRNNISQFYQELEMELGILSGANNCRMNSFLHSNEKFRELYKSYFLSSIFHDEQMSIVSLIEIVIEIFENEFGIEVQNFNEVERILEEHNIGGNNESIDTDQIETFESSKSEDDVSQNTVEEFVKRISGDGEFRNLPHVEMQRKEQEITSLNQKEQSLDDDL